jgi:hypothetical protein
MSTMADWNLLCFATEFLDRGRWRTLYHVSPLFLSETTFSQAQTITLVDKRNKENFK